MKPATLTEVQNAMRHLVTAVANSRLYSLDHPQVARLCNAARQCFANLLKNRSELSLMMVEGVMLCDDFPLPPGLHAQKLAELLEQRRINRMLVMRGVESGELFELVAFLVGTDPRQVAPPAGAHLRFETLEHSPPSAPEKASGPITPTSRDALQSVKISGQDRLAEIFEDVSRRQAIRVAGLTDIVTGFIEAFSREIPSLLTLMPLRSMDEYTFTHGLNVCLLNLAQAMHLGIGGQLLHDIGIAALLHDIGKLFIPMEVLGKPGKLDEQEWALMQQHPVRGARHLLDNPGVPQLAVVTAFEHHVRYNLSGYPAVHGQWRQHLCSHMTTISDVYDALRTRRPYQEPHPPEQCAAILLKLAGRELHPQLAASFLYLLDQISQD